MKKLVLASVFLSATAFAGPTVTVNVKNQGTKDINYHVITTNESMTKVNSNPKPKERLMARETNRFTVANPLNPAVGSAALRYRTADGRECVFSTGYMALPQFGGNTIPKWTKNASGSGGAFCSANIIFTNPTTHDWEVEFVMR